MQCIYIRINVYQTKSNLEDKQRGLEATTRSTGTKHRHIYVAENECFAKGGVRKQRHELPRTAPYTQNGLNKSSFWLLLLPLFLIDSL